MLAIATPEEMRAIDAAALATTSIETGAPRLVVARRQAGSGSELMEFFKRMVWTSIGSYAGP